MLLVVLYRNFVSKIIKGVLVIAKIIPAKAPIVEIAIASNPRPCKSILWPGKIERAVSASGAPKKIEGIIEIKTFEIAMEVMKMAKVRLWK